MPSVLSTTSLSRLDSTVLVLLLNIFLKVPTIEESLAFDIIDLPCVVDMLSVFFSVSEVDLEETSCSCLSCIEVIESLLRLFTGPDIIYSINQLSSQLKERVFIVFFIY